MNFGEPEIFPVAIIGAGPAGLTAAWELARHGVGCVVLEASGGVGGLARTVEYRGFRFDVGPHRFFSKSAEVEKLWDMILAPETLRTLPRRTRILYRGRFFSYPLEPGEAMRKLGLAESFRCLGSLIWAKLRPRRPVESFEDWTVNAFGRRLFSIFFKTYTEKLWGMPTSKISADWAAQRIRGLSVGAAVVEAARARFFRKSSRKTPTTLVDRFRYPARGAGSLWERCAEKVEKLGGRVGLQSRVQSCRYDGDARRWEIRVVDADGVPATVRAEAVISSAPLGEWLIGLPDQMGERVRAAAKGLRYRDLICVNLIVPKIRMPSDHWLYVHDSELKVVRITNFGAWSEAMVGDQENTGVGLEYFCDFGDEDWRMDDEALLARGVAELAKLGFISAGLPPVGCVVRQRRAYPIYDEHYAENIRTLRRHLAKHFPSFHLVGRNGMHRYNNQDHSMATAQMTARNIYSARASRDPWAVNQDAQYIEPGGTLE